MTQLPIICWFQTGNYSIQIVDSQTMQEALTPRQGTYTGGDNPTVLSVTFDTGFERDRYYEAVVTVETVAGSSNTSVHFSELESRFMTVTLYIPRYPIQLPLIFHILVQTTENKCE